MTIQFDGNEIVYPRNEWYKIRLAYAMSIHKSQGSEFPVVILPITNQSNRMLQRNLIYTAITRSKSKLILLGEYSAFDYATKNTGTARKTYLVERFKDLDGGEATTDYSSSLATASATVESARSKEETVETKAETSKPTIYRLTEDNLHTISPMIGLTEEEIAPFFDIKNTTSNKLVVFFFFHQRQLGMIHEIGHGDTQEADSSICRFNFLKNLASGTIDPLSSRVGSVNVIRLVRVVKSP